MTVDIHDIRSLVDSDVTALSLASIIEGILDPRSIEACERWVRQCFHEPRWAEQVLEAANELMGGFGVEAIRVEGAWVDSYHGDIVATYVNTGDTYAPTLLLDSETGEFLVTSYGDWLEAYEAEQEQEEED